MRWGPGPVFVFEFSVTARRWQVYLTRVLCVLGLLAALAVVWSAEFDGKDQSTIRGQAQAGQYYSLALIGTQLALVLLVAPAFAAGAICHDRSRGALHHVLVTDLSDAEIVLGKLAARLIPVAGLVACALPVLSVGALLGGIDPVALGMAFLVALAVAVFGCVLALTISVWAVRTHEVLMAVYALWAVVLLFYPIWQMLSLSGLGLRGPPRWLVKFNPCWLSFSPYLAPNEVEWTDFARFVAGSVVLSATLTALAIARLRPVTEKHSAQSLGGKDRARLSLGARLRRVLPGPSLDQNPVLWREWHRRRPSRLARLVWWGYFGAFTCGGVYSLAQTFRVRTPAGLELGMFLILGGVGLGLLLLSVTASTTLFEERTRGSIDVLLATPLSTRAILWGKWWGTFRAAPWLAFWPTVVMSALAFSGPYIMFGFPRYVIDNEIRLYAVAQMALIVLVHSAAVTSLGLALATWMSRPGRAAGLCAATSVMVSVGWVFLMALLFKPSSQDAAEALMGPSPIFAAVNLCQSIVYPYRDPTGAIARTSYWLLAVAAAAALLFGLTYATFDRCLGRISERKGVSRSALP
jgi:ABC-type transport system involved in multi-copper enzyme maturation permease subunit